MDNAKNFKRVALLVLGAVLLFWGLNNYSIIFNFLAVLWGYLFPFILGIAIAFLLNMPMRFIEKKIFALSAKMKKKFSLKIVRPISLVLTVLIFIAVIFTVLIVAVPQIASAFVSLKDQIPAFFSNIQKFVADVSLEMPNISNILSKFSLDFGNISNKIASTLSSFGEKALSSSFSLATSVFGGIVNFCFAIIFAFYILMSKEALCRQLDKSASVLLPEKCYIKIRALLSLIDSTFTSFFSGQCLEALASGTLFFIGMRIFGFPYAALISVLIAVMALIPILGAFISFAIGTFLILVQSPIQALWFAVLFVVLQQIDGNFIYPRIVGTSVGLPAIWVLLAVTLGGSMFGVIGVVIFIPSFSVLYTLFRQFINERSQEKGVSNELETRN